MGKQIRLVLFAALMLSVVGAAQAAIAFRASSFAGVMQPTISYRAAGNARSAASGNITPTLSGVELNALLVCVVEQHDNVAISFPAGWTQLYSISTTTTHRASVFYKLAAATEANPVITHPGGGGIIARCATFRGADAVNPLDVAYAANYAVSSLNVTSGSLNTLTANDMMLYAMHIANNPLLGLLPGGPGGVAWTQRFYNSAGLLGTSTAAIGLYTGTKATAGAVGPITSTITAASENHGVLLALHNGTTLSISVPAGTMAGDVMIAAIATTPSGVTITAPAGWTPIQAITQAAATSNRVSSYYRVATASEPASYRWTLTASHAGATGGIASYIGVDNANPIDVSAGQATPSSTNHAAPSITTTVAGDMLVTVHEYASARSWTPPAGMTERVDIASRSGSTAGVTLEMNDLLLGAAGATGVETATASASADTGATVSIALRPVAPPNHIRIEHHGGACSGSGAPAQITLKACANAACTALYTATDVSGIVLSPATGGYTWTPANPQTISAVSGGINSAIFLARNTAGTATLAITGTPNPAPSNVYECYNANTGISGDCSLVFGSGAFTFNVPDHTADTSQVVTVTSCKGSFAGTTRSVKFWSTFVNPASGTQQGKVVAGTGNADCATGYSALGASSASPTTLSLVFGSGSSPQATFSMCYPDAGQVQVDARYDGSTATGDNGIVILGNDRFIAVPHHFTLSNIACGNGTTYTGCIVASPYANPATASAAGTGFMKAGNPFSLTVTAYNANGAVTPNFGQENLTLPAPSNVPENVALTLAANMPDLPGAVAGNLTGTFGSFSNGVATGNAFVYDEAGIMTLSAKLASGNYLGSGLKEITTPSSGNIGRFIPDHFAISTDLVSPILARASFGQVMANATGTIAPSTVIDVDVTTGFHVGDRVRIPGAGAGGNALVANVTAVDPAALTLTLDAAIGTTLNAGDDVIDEWGSYMGEQFNAQFSLSAVDLNGNVTQNYQGAYAKLNPAAAGNPLGFGAVNAGVDLTSRLDTSLSASGSFASGIANIGAPLAISRGASPDGPYAALQIGIAPTTAESDGVRMGAYDLNVGGSLDHTSVMDAAVQATTEVRYGRVKVSNGYGSELLPLTVTATAQYYTANGWIGNIADSVTALALASPYDLLNAGGTVTGTTAASFVAPADATCLPYASGSVCRDSSTINLAKPIGGAGVATITPTVVACASPATCYLPVISGTATFGVYKNNNNYIYRRER